ncbi:MAG TPA: FlgD immunoglobulin-like domain containing protein, partial [Candidatus Cloacimonadota bacterium]|nr:FlgD immunoglobulin-like domain containing protein [Candidatus Cloacimonadota bacterium]
DLPLDDIPYPPSDAVATMDPVTRYATISWTAATPPRGSGSAVSARKALTSRSSKVGVSRILTGYWVWRLAFGAENYPAQWQLLNTEPQSGLSLVDSLWLELPEFDYRWAVQAVYSGVNTSPAVFTNTLNPVSLQDAHIPEVVTALGTNYPNPFREHTQISFSLKDATPVHLEVYNIKGNLVRTLHKGELKSGSHSILFDGCDARGKRLPAGVYIYRFEAGIYRKASKMVLL